MANNRRALIVGIDHYTRLAPLSGCVNDAIAMKDVLEWNADGSPNFENPQLLIDGGGAAAVTQKALRGAVDELFSDEYADIALLYFAGHGHAEDTGGYLCTGEFEGKGDGLPLVDVMTLATNCKARNKVIILDCCKSGSAGNKTTGERTADIAEGITILTASQPNRNSFEMPGGGAGVYTSLLVEALHGAAANLLGEVSVGSAYAYIDLSLGNWAQRPMFKTHVNKFVHLRTAKPPIPIEDLRQLAVHFPSPKYRFPLDPAYEPERNGSEPAGTPPPDPEGTKVFAQLQRYNRVNLVRPVDAPHMWHAAMWSKSCELTVLGQHYRELAAKGRLGRATT